MSAEWREVPLVLGIQFVHDGVVDRPVDGSVEGTVHSGPHLFWCGECFALVDDVLMDRGPAWTHPGREVPDLFVVM